MQARLTIAILLAAASAETPARAAEPAPVITCTSLANLRTVLRDAGDDPTAAVPTITDPKSDLGCTVLDRKAVTGIADHVALNGRAYECLSLQNTSVCHWTVAGSAAPVAPTSPDPAPAGPPQGKAKR